MNHDSPISRLYAYLSAGNIFEDIAISSSVFRTAHSTPHASSRPTLTRGKRQMSQKHMANRRKASAKARMR